MRYQWHPAGRSMLYHGGFYSMLGHTYAVFKLNSGHGSVSGVPLAPFWDVFRLIRKVLLIMISRMASTVAVQINLGVLLMMMSGVLLAFIRPFKTGATQYTLLELFSLVTVALSALMGLINLHEEQQRQLRGDGGGASAEVCSASSVLTVLLNVCVFLAVFYHIGRELVLKAMDMTDDTMAVAGKWQSLCAKARLRIMRETDWEAEGSVVKSRGASKVGLAKGPVPHRSSDVHSLVAAVDDQGGGGPIIDTSSDVDWSMHANPLSLSDES